MYNARNVELFVNVDFKIATFTSVQREGFQRAIPAHISAISFQGKKRLLSISANSLLYLYSEGIWGVPFIPLLVYMFGPVVYEGCYAVRQGAPRLAF